MRHSADCGWGGGLNRSRDRGLGEDALEQGRGGLRAMRLQHAEQSRSALRVGEHPAAHIAGGDMAVEGRLIGCGEGAVDRVGEHGLTVGAPGAGAERLRASELVDLSHFHHLSFYLDRTISNHWFGTDLLC